MDSVLASQLMSYQILSKIQETALWMALQSLYTARPGWSVKVTKNEINTAS